MATAKRQRRSAVWEHFTFSNEKEDIHPTCNICKAQVKASDSNTTNLRNHLMRIHNITVETREVKKRASTSCTTTTTTTSGSTSNDLSNNTPSLLQMWTKLDRKSKRHRDITMAIARYIAIDLRPLDSVNDSGFTQLIKTLEPRYDMDSRTHITQSLLPTMYDDLKNKIKDKLASAKQVSLTTDGWTSRGTKSFITVTAHIINESWKAESFVLSTEEFEESHTGDNLSKQFDNVLVEWNLNKENVSVTTDNAANICLAMRLSGIKHVKCMAHTLNLATQKCLAINQFSRVCGKVRRIVSYLHKSTTVASLLRKTLVQLELPSLKPVIDVPTRWNSTLEMLERYAQLRPAISVVLSNPIAKNQCANVTEDETAIIEALIKVSTCD